MDPRNHILLSNRSAAYVGLQDFNKALADATACVDMSPDFVKGYSRKGYAFLQLSQPGFAEAAYRQGLSKDPQKAGLLQSLASILKVCLCGPDHVELKSWSPFPTCDKGYVKWLQQTLMFCKTHPDSRLIYRFLV